MNRIRIIAVSTLVAALFGTIRPPSASVSNPFAIAQFTALAA